jgi:PHP family Zn ribbon phosphoesterase
VQTREEVHMLTLFDTVEQALAWQREVFNHLPDLRNNEDHFGAQFVVDATGEYIRRNERLLVTSTDLSLERAVAMVEDLDGLALPAHVDRPAFSLLTNLGFVPPDLNLPALEIFRSSQEAEVRRRFPETRGFTLVCNSDAHRLNEMTARTMFKIATPTVAELVLALQGKNGRRVEVI